jgi:hypothetical protein
VALKAPRNLRGILREVRHRKVSNRIFATARSIEFWEFNAPRTPFRLQRHGDIPVDSVPVLPVGGVDPRSVQKPRLAPRCLVARSSYHYISCRTMERSSSVKLGIIARGWRRQSLGSCRGILSMNGFVTNFVVWPSTLAISGSPHQSFVWSSAALHI